ncbi:hypothetical protein ACFWA9_04150 [Kitasatospora sp. NPDC059973]|uniref:hypothetical protein n=1 Tax=Kitasatospora sp. NPDC059973 TaxID=3347020 RepID=UPI003693697C
MSWQGWNKMPTGTTQSALAASGSVHVFGRGNDDVIYHSGLSSGEFPATWSAWKALGGLVAVAGQGPATTVQAGSVYAFALNGQGRIFYTRWNGAGADGWHEIPGGLVTPSPPAVAPGVIVARQVDGTLRFNTFDGAGPTLTFGSWRGTDGTKTLSAPAITAFGAGYFLFLRGENNGIYYRSLGADRASWGAWQSVPGGGLTYDAPAVAESLLVVRGTDNGLHWNTFDGGLSWTGWQRAGGLTYSAPALTHSGSFFTLVARGTDDGIHYNFFD